jgi:uncharacterized protein (UPF0335 family)
MCRETVVSGDAGGLPEGKKDMAEEEGAPAETTDAQATDGQLRLFIERIERLEEEKKGISDDISDTYGEAKAQGYDAKIMRQIVRLRKLPPHDRAEMEALLDLYKAALGLG